MCTSISLSCKFSFGGEYKIHDDFNVAKIHWCRQFFQQVSDMTNHLHLLLKLEIQTFSYVSRSVHKNILNLLSIPDLVQTPPRGVKKKIHIARVVWSWNERDITSFFAFNIFLFIIILLSSRKWRQINFKKWCLLQFIPLHSLGAVLTHGGERYPLLHFSGISVLFPQCPIYSGKRRRALSVISLFLCLIASLWGGTRYFHLLSCTFSCSFIIIC